MKKQKKSKVSDEFDDFENAEEYQTSEAEYQEINDVENIKEDPDQKRLRLAKELIEKTKKNIDQESFSEDDNNNYFIQTNDNKDNQNVKVNEYMQKQVLERKRKIHKLYKQKISDFYQANNKKLPIQNLKGHKKPITTCCFNPVTNDLYTVGKDGAILKFKKNENFKRFLFQDSYPKNNNGHSMPILSIDICFDGKYLITGDKSGNVKIWDLLNNNLHHQFKAHQKSVNSLKFRLNSYEFFSASSDAQLKLWDAHQKGMIEQHFGHRSQMFEISALTENQMVSIGYDRRPIVWKIDQEKQMLFQERLFSLDCVTALNKYYFVTGSEDGEIAVWNVSKKKPRIVNNNLHKKGWISCLASIYNGDILISGANDGQLNFYEINCQNLTQEKFCNIFSVQCQGIINDIQFSSDNQYLAVVVSSENKLGRWTVQDKIKSHIKIIKLFN